MVAYDKFETIAAYSDVSVVILGNEATRDYALFPLDVAMWPPIVAHFRERGFYFIGVIGLQNGAPCVAFDCELDAESSAAILALFLGTYKRAVPLIEEQARKAQSQSWLEQLYTLPDSRPQI